MLLNAVCREHAELGVLVHAEPDVLRGGTLDGGGRALRQRIAAQPVRVDNAIEPAAAAEIDDACPVLVDVEERVFGVMGDEAEAAILAGSIAETIPVVRRIIAEEVGDRRVEIAAVEDDEHVVDHVRDIDEVFVGEVGRAVHV